VFIPDSLRRRAESSPKEKFWVLVEAVPGARLAARARVTAHGGVVVPDPDGLPPENPFLFAKLTGDSIAPLEAASADVIASIEEDHEGFNKQNLTNSLILEPLLSQINDDPDRSFDVIIDVNQDSSSGRAASIATIREYLGSVGASRVSRRPDATHPYVFATLTGKQISEVAKKDRGACIYKIWEDSEIHALISRSVATVKADAAQIAFSARGRDVVWAVMDSGIQRGHMHFDLYKNLEPPEPVHHQDFSIENGTEASALTDAYGHGTHVAGILAGQSEKAVIVNKVRKDDGSIGYVRSELTSIFGMAPECKLVSMKVLDDRGSGKVSALIEAIESIQRINDYGRRTLIHGVNMSLGYEFDPEWFACGQSPLCVEVNRLVKSGVIVVVAAGNTGYGFVRSADRVDAVAAGLPLSINDPGNAELAITVGSTHRYMPHTYGVSYFSSKGPTCDGRCKPDLVAPGEKIISCAAGRSKSKLQAAAGVVGDFQYLEDSGTSMAAPHVSGVIAAFLSIRPEFRGEPEKVKRIFLDAAVDLGRDRMFQGTGLVDLMRAIQNV
jgi:serine protease AprX